jgi:mRNA-degrading endonuclease toxin of MazEF toxin-antitoxin module
MIRPGEIYMADFGPAGPHPVIVTSRETLNRGRYALVVPCRVLAIVSSYKIV